ncbi:MAG TPA: trypsin-like serine protease [Polyangiaceae bacterium]|nr:trypsin-like serine protease [Polyangiaceae bacterium]
MRQRLLCARSSGSRSLILGLLLTACGIQAPGGEAPGASEYPLKRTDPRAILRADLNDYPAFVTPTFGPRDESKRRTSDATPELIEVDLATGERRRVQVNRQVPLTGAALERTMGIDRASHLPSNVALQRILLNDPPRLNSDGGAIAEQEGVSLPALQKLTGETPMGTPAAAVGGSSDVKPGDLNRLQVTGVRFDTTQLIAASTVKVLSRYPDGHGMGCSGKLIGARTVLTAGHCLHWSDYKGTATSVQVIPGLDGTYMPYGDANSRRIWLDPTWESEQDNDNDWGMIVLDRDIGNVAGQFGWWAASQSSLDGLGMDFYGYPGTSNRMYTSPGNVTCTDSWLAFFSNELTDGFSGSALHASTGSKTEFAFGVASHTNSKNIWCSLSGMNAGVRITSSRASAIAAVRDSGAAGFEGDNSLWTPLGGLSNAPITSVSWGKNRSDIFVRGLDNAAWHKGQTNTEFYPAIDDWDYLGGEIVGTVAAASRGANLLDLFVRSYGEPAQACTKAWDPSGWWPSSTDWVCFPDLVIKGNPSVVSTLSDRLHVFGRNKSNHVLEKAWTGAAGWLASSDLGGNTDQEVAVVSRADYMWDAFIRDIATGAVFTKARNGGALWPSGTDWASLGGKILGAPVVVSSGSSNLDVFGVNDGGNVQWWSWRGGDWAASKNLGGNAQMRTVLSAVSRAANRVDVFGVGNDNHVYWKSLNGSTWTPANASWTDLGGDMIDVNAVSWSSSRIDLYARDRNLGVRWRFYNGSTWSTP